MSLKPLLRPKSIAVVGASQTPGKLGHVILENLRHFKGKVYPVNPKHYSVLGIKSYPSVAAINKSIDIAIIAVPAPLVPKVLKSAKNAKSVVLISSGFSEVGNEELATEVLNLIRKNKQRLLGPNCLGIQVPHLYLNATFAPKLSKPGGIAFVSQSGGFGSAMLDWAHQERIGFSAFVSVGNTLDINFSELLHNFSGDRHTKAIVLYIEGLKDGREFLKAAKKCKKPIIVFKVGKTEIGKKAAATHTASMAGEAKIYSGIFKQANIIEAKSTDELFDLVKGFALVKKPKTKKVVIVTNSGGPGTAAADSVSHPLTLHKNTVIDLTGSATSETFSHVLDSLKKIKASFLVIYVPTSIAEPGKITKAIAEFTEGRTVLTSCMGGFLACHCGTIIKTHCAANFDSPERAINVLKKLVQS